MSTMTILPAPRTALLLGALLAPPLASLPSAPPSPAPGPAEQLLKERDQEDLGEALAEYFQAREEGSGAAEAMEELDETFGKMARKLDGKNVLSATEDLGRALWYSYAYDKVKGVRRGRADEVELPIPFFGEGHEVTYVVSTPKEYRGKEPWPLLLILPDAGESVAEHIDEHWPDPVLRDNALVVVCPMPEKVEAWTAIGGDGSPGGVGVVLSVMGDVLRKYAVDYDRVYLVGRGAGVDAAVQIASTSGLDRFAGVAGRAGDPREATYANFKNLPTWFAGGGAGATAFEEKVRELGYGNCTLAPEGKEADLWAWIEAHPRSSNPAEVVLVPGSPFPNKAFWIEVPPFDGEGEARVTAKVDRESNTIQVDGTGVTHVTISFNDELVDLDKPVTVKINGTEHKDEIPRNLTTFLQLCWSGQNDPGKLYVARKRYDLPTSVAEE